MARDWYQTDTEHAGRDESWGLSKGWIFQLSVGLGWAFVVARLVPATVRRVFAGLLLIAVVSTALTLWHRHVSGIRDVKWPIGTITTCGALGAVWACLGAGRLLGAWSQRAAPRRHVATGHFARHAALLAATVLAVSLVWLSARRAGWLGLAAGAVLAAALNAILRSPRRRTPTAILSILCLMIAACGVWVAARMPVPNRTGPGSTDVRLWLWSATLERLVEQPLLGFGPDM